MSVRPAYGDVARAARLISAVRADDVPGLMAVIGEADEAGRLAELSIAAAAQCASIADEYFDVDAQEMLNRRAFDAVEAAQSADG